MNPLLEVDGLQVTFTSHEQKLFAVRGISFNLFEGESLGIVGESGCGKSAASKAILRLLPLHSSHLKGQVRYRDKNLLVCSEKEMQSIRGKEIAMIFQDPMTSLNPTTKIGMQIAEGYLRHHPHVKKKEALDYAIQMLDKVGIPQPKERAEEFPHTLSGGMRQRAMIATALASEPHILIADEPTTALDVTIQAQILTLLKKIQQDTATSIILITHDLSVVAGFCDRVLVMYAGKIVESASVYDLFNRPKHPYTQRLLQAIPRLDLPKARRLEPIEGSPPNLLSLPKGCAFAPRCPSRLPHCETNEPELIAIGENDHRSACHLHSEEKLS